MRLDLHTHSRYSPDARQSPADLVTLARRIGIAGIALTDHNSIGGIREAEEAAGRDVLVIPATEVSTRSGHVLAYGVREPLPRDLSITETVERVVALGGVAVAAHPYRFWSGIGEAGLDEIRFPAFETYNARTLRRGNERAREKARSLRIGETGGSDSHFPDELGKAVTEFDVGVVRADDVVQWIGQGKTTAQGADRGAAATVRYVSKCVGEWILRGMRRI